MAEVPATSDGGLPQQIRIPAPGYFAITPYCAVYSFRLNSGGVISVLPEGALAPFSLVYAWPVRPAMSCMLSAISSRPRSPTRRWMWLDVTMSLSTLSP